MKRKVLIVWAALVLSAAVIAVAVAGNFRQTQKEQFLEDLQTLSAETNQLRMKWGNLTKMYYAKGYNSSGSYELVGGDLTGTAYEGITIGQVTAVITTAESFETWIASGHGDNLAKIIK